MSRKIKKDCSIMGMASSQARLLSLTSRMHNIELKIQDLESRKVELAVQQDKIYQDYCDAMDAKKIQVSVKDANGKITYVDANYSTICRYQPFNTTQCSLVNNLTGRVIVQPEIKDLYERYTDKYMFAWAAMGYPPEQATWQNSDYGPFGAGGAAFGAPENIGIGTHTNTNNTHALEPSGTGIWDEWDCYDENGNLPACGYDADLYMSEAEYLVFLRHYKTDSGLRDAYDELYNASKTGKPVAERKQLLDAFRSYLYKNFSQQILNAMNMDKESEAEDPSYLPENIPPAYNNNLSWSDCDIGGQFNYYVNLWEQIHNSGGCETIDEQYMSGDEGTKWFNAMFQAGIISMFTMDTATNKGWTETTLTTVASSTYLKEVSDEVAIKKAEREYDYMSDILNKKDTELDKKISTYQTEESTCKAEMDGIKKFIRENSDRTFSTNA